MKSAAFLLLLAVSPALAQAPGTDAPAGARRVLTASPAPDELRVDGRFDEPAWAAAEAASDFTQSYPNPGAAPSQRTEVRVLVGKDALYVGARMFDTHPDSIAAQLTRRDAFGSYSDRVMVFVDSRHDRRTGFSFSVNPRGVKQDTYLFDDGAEDASWDAVWDVATTVDSAGWTAEFRIPFSQLRFAEAATGGGERSWGFAVMREVARHAERDTWSPWRRNDAGFVSRFGELRGLGGVRAPRPLEVLPYTSARVERAPGDRSDPFYRSNRTAASVGADLRYGLPGGLNLTATVNPDFGQVELDPAVVNLTAFETFLPERRPFFVEGADIFRFGEINAFNTYGFSQYFYSRRVGRSPQRFLDSLYVDAPEQSTILAAAKVSGKTSGGWSVGLMDAVTAREEARFGTASGARGESPVEPLSNYFVGRLRRDLNGGRTVVGGMLTGVNRDMGDGVFDGFLRGNAYLAGVDGQHAWGNREWVLSGFLAGSRVGGSAAALEQTQLSSARYYQRPDADHLELDPTRTSLAGHTGALGISHSGRWDLSLVYQETSPGFEINDGGFQSRADSRSFATFLGQRRERPTRALRDASYYVYTTHARNFGGDRTYEGYGTGINGTLNNLWNAGVELNYNPETTNDRLTRGGPLTLTPSQWAVSANAGSDTRKRVSASGSARFSRGDYGIRERSAQLSLSMRPSSSLQLSVGPSLARDERPDQYVRVRADTLARSTFGRRYVFAELDQTTLALDTRVNWTFSPTLSLEVFAQPFVTSADFDGYKELSAAGTFDFDVYGRDRGTIARDSRGGYLVDPDGTGAAGAFGFPEQDFTFRSLRGNAVLRWEYRPGSAVFLVWQQVRSGDRPFADFDAGRDVRGLFTEPGQNVFLIKATYWIGR